MEAWQGKIAPKKIATAFALLVVSGGIWFQEVSHQSKLCGRLHHCASMADETLANYTAARESFLVVLDAKDYLPPPQWWDSNQFRARLWIGSGGAGCNRRHVIAQSAG